MNIGNVVKVLMAYSQKYDMSFECKRDGFVLRKEIDDNKIYAKWYSFTELLNLNLTWDDLIQHFLEEANRELEGKRGVRNNGVV